MPTVVVTDLSLSALRDTVRTRPISPRRWRAATKPLLVANQVGAEHRGEIGRPEFERGIGGALDYAVPFDVKAMMATAQSGKALPDAAGGSKAATELRKLAARLAGREQEKPRGGLLSRFKK